MIPWRKKKNGWVHTKGFKLFYMYIGISGNDLKDKCLQCIKKNRIGLWPKLIVNLKTTFLRHTWCRGGVEIELTCLTAYCFALLMYRFVCHWNEQWRSEGHGPCNNPLMQLGFGNERTSQALNILKNTIKFINKKGNKCQTTGLCLEQAKTLSM